VAEPALQGTVNTNPSDLTSNEGLSVGFIRALKRRLGDYTRPEGRGPIEPPFASLDAALAERSGMARKFLFFLIVGVVLFAGSLWLERRRTRDQ